jgi:hypothetical protein
VIRDDGTVVDITLSHASYDHSTNVWFVKPNRIDMTFGTVFSYYYRFNEIPIADTEITLNTKTATGQNPDYFASANSAINQASIDQYLVGNQVGDASVQTNGIVEEAVGGFQGLNIVPPDNRIAYVTAAWNSGYLCGDAKGAFLSDTDDTDVTGGELVTNGTFASDTDWTKGTGWTISGGTLNIADETTSSAVYNSGGSVLDPSKSYIVTFTISASTANFGVQIRLSNSSGTYRYTPGTYYTADGAYSVTIPAGSFSAVDALMGFYRVGSHTGSLSIDNVSVKVADADRSVNANGIIVNGTITKTAVATGAELVGYSGFSATNYLEQPYNSDLDFGTGDFSVMGWFNQTLSTSTQYLAYRTDGTNVAWSAGMTATNDLLFVISSDGIPARTAATAYLDNTWNQVAFVREAGIAKIYLNGSLVPNTAAGTSVGTVSLAASLVYIGDSPISNPFVGSLALIRISATAPTAAQLTKIYNDEKFLFQENAACTLYGTSDVVTALAHDDATDLLHVGTSAGRSTFQGLRRVSNTTTAVGTAISASDNLVVEE